MMLNIQEYVSLRLLISSVFCISAQMLVMMGMWLDRTASYANVLQDDTRFSISAEVTIKSITLWRPLLVACPSLRQVPQERRVCDHFTHGENGILKTDTLDKAYICNRQFESAFTCESDTEIPSKGTSPFIPMGEITVDPKGVLKLLNNLNIHAASGPDGLSARVLKECSSVISPMLALTYNESLAQGTVPDD